MQEEIYKEKWGERWGVLGRFVWPLHLVHLGSLKQSPSETSDGDCCLKLLF